MSLNEKSQVFSELYSLSYPTFPKSSKRKRKKKNFCLHSPLSNHPLHFSYLPLSPLRFIVSQKPSHWYSHLGKGGPFIFIILKSFKISHKSPFFGTLILGKVDHSYLSHSHSSSFVSFLSHFELYTLIN